LLTDFSLLTPADVLLEADGIDFLDIVFKFTADGDSLMGLKLADFQVLTDQGAGLGQPGATFVFQLQATQIPEPATLLCWLVAGAVGGLWFRRRAPAAGVPESP
jgi:hypothetical protein